MSTIRRMSATLRLVLKKTDQTDSHVRTEANKSETADEMSIGVGQDLFIRNSGMNNKYENRSAGNSQQAGKPEEIYDRLKIESN